MRYATRGATVFAILMTPTLVSNDYRRRGGNFSRPCSISFCDCRVQKHGVRIIIGNFYENKAGVIFCEAFKQKMYGAKYAWIITGNALACHFHVIFISQTYISLYFVDSTSSNFHDTRSSDTECRNRPTTTLLIN